MTKLVPLKTWAIQHYAPPPSGAVLRWWRLSGQISPAPERVGRTWYCREDARRVPTAHNPTSTADAVVDEIWSAT